MAPAGIASPLSQAPTRRIAHPQLPAFALAKALSARGDCPRPGTLSCARKIRLETNVLWPGHRSLAGVATRSNHCGQPKYRQRSDPVLQAASVANPGDPQRSGSSTVLSGICLRRARVGEKQVRVENAVFPLRCSFGTSASKSFAVAFSVRAVPQYL